MSPQVAQLIEQINSLSPEEYAELRYKLALQDQAETEEKEDERLGEIAAARLDGILSGKVQAIPGEVVMERIRERFGF
ncbi:MAG: hypothetical protein SFY68_10750 [Candidatus Sumerlaeia bacterium]|nr:hypothetical protein [Candidatus Sumerlaeia bacterium]